MFRIGVIPGLEGAGAWTLAGDVAVDVVDDQQAIGFEFGEGLLCAVGAVASVDENEVEVCFRGVIGGVCVMGGRDEAEIDFGVCLVFLKPGFDLLMPVGVMFDGGDMGAMSGEVAGAASASEFEDVVRRREDREDAAVGVAVEPGSAGMKLLIKDGEEAVAKVGGGPAFRGPLCGEGDQGISLSSPVRVKSS